MPKPRSQQISITDTPYYHCVSRCVRRAFLCGKDEQTGKSYEHRRAWVEKRLLLLSSVFAINVCAYTVMHNHTHVILYIDDEKAKNWSMDEVLQHWHQLYKGTLFTQQYLKGETLVDSAIDCVKKTAEIYRNRLMDISWFMRALNEPIARQANSEDNCTGRFWEGRFKSQALLDESALIACMAYVDLNPIRANIAKTPEKSAYTSIKQRVNSAIKGTQPKNLLPFIGNHRKNMPKGIAFKLQEYIELVDITGRCIRDDKRGYINGDNAKILDRLGISEESWLTLTLHFEQVFKGAVGAQDAITQYTKNQNLKRRQSITNSIKLLKTA